ncbi:MAG: hypothetical protein AABW56_02380 [Nanoarchaeota archaeon]
MKPIKINNNLREFHLWDLPNYIRINLEEKNRKGLFNHVLKQTKTIRNLTKLIQKETNKKISFETVRSYIIGNYYIPLWFLNKIINLFYDRDFYSKIERKIIAFRGPRGDIIYNPNFPWKEDVRIIRIVIRLIGDGHAGGGISIGRVPVYSNSCKELTEQFINDLNFFGKVKFRKYTLNEGKRCSSIEFPKVIGHILKHLYKIDFRGKYARLSNKIYSLPRNIVIEAIKVYGDDEGSMKGTEIHFYSENKELLQDFINLFKLKLPEFTRITNVRVSAIKEKKFTTYYFAILAKDLKKYFNLIGFNHPMKQRKLIHQINCQNKIKNSRYNGITKGMILKSLINNPKTSYEISEEVLINHRTVNKHINGYSDKGRYFKGLRELGLVKSISKSSEGILWGLTK